MKTTYCRQKIEQATIAGVFPANDSDYNRSKVVTQNPCKNWRRRNVQEDELLSMLSSLMSISTA